MRPALISGVTMLLTAVCAAPAVAVPVPLPEALESVTAACASTSSALTSVGGRAVDGDSSVAVTGDRFAVSGPGTNRVAIAGEGTFGAVADDGLRPKDRRAALRYIKRPGATWWLNPGAFWSPAAGWSATFDDAARAAVPLSATCAQDLAAADSVDRDGSRWVFTLPGEGPFVVVTDGQGRVTRFGAIAITYGAQSITAPAGAVSFAAWQKASQAASLNSTMKQISRAVAASVNASGPNVAAIDAATRAAVPTDRVVALKVRQLRRGVLIYGRNPYTKTYHAWRIYVKGGEAVARRVAP
ncbi:MAG TPA: hypothetical protein PK902_04705 [Actinomycetota bacterium]|nr:hypothetical protein [Actinomycetota bacterium]